MSRSSYCPPDRISLNDRGHQFLAELVELWTSFDETDGGATMRHLAAAYSHGDFFEPSEQLNELCHLIFSRLGWMYGADREYNPFEDPQHQGAIKAAQAQFPSILRKHHTQAQESDDRSDALEAVREAAAIVPWWMLPQQDFRDEEPPLADVFALAEFQELQLAMQLEELQPTVDKAAALQQRLEDARREVAEIWAEMNDALGD
jgi:hypothetical protein